MIPNKTSNLIIWNPKLDMKISVCPFVRLFVHVPRLCYPHWILKRGGLESSGWRLISSIGKTNRIAFCFVVLATKVIFDIFFGFFEIFLKKIDFFCFFNVFMFLIFLNFFRFTKVTTKSCQGTPGHQKWPKIGQNSK